MHADRGRKKKVKENSWALLPPVVLVKSLFALRPTGRLFLRCQMAKVDRVLPGDFPKLAESNRFVVSLVTDDPNLEFSDFVVNAFAGLTASVAFVRIYRADIVANQRTAATVLGQLRDTLGHVPFVIPTGYYLSHGCSLITFHAGEIPGEMRDVALYGLGIGILARLFGAKDVANDVLKGTATILNASKDASSGKALREAAERHLKENKHEEKEKEKENNRERKQEREGANTQAKWSMVRETLAAMNTLGINKDFGTLTPAEIKAAHRAMMQQVHPDRFGGEGEEANRAAAKVNAARDLLLKAIADRDGAAAA